MEGKTPAGKSGTILYAFTTKETAVEVLPRSRTTTKVLFERVELEIRPEGTGRAALFDSKAPRKPAEGGAEDADVAGFSPPLAALKAFPGGSFEIVQSPTGLVEQIEGAEEMKDRILKEGPDEAPFRTGAERFTSPVFLGQVFRPLIVMPDRGFAAEQVLHFQDLRLLPDTSGVPGFLYYKGTYRLAEVKEGVARVEMEAETSLDPYGNMQPWPPSVAKGRERLRLARGVCRAWATVRVETGALEEAEHVTDLDLHFVKPDGSGEVPIPVKVTLRVQRIP